MHISKTDAQTLSFIAPGKLIMMGEYAVLEGAPALVASIAVYARAHIQRTTKSYSTFSSINLREKPLDFEFKKNSVRFIEHGSENSFPFIRNLLLELSRLELHITPQFDMTLDTSDFYTRGGLKYGLGSSAATTVAAAYAMLCFMNVETDRKFLLRLAGRAHLGAQGNIGSGIDLAASVYGGVIRFQMSQSDKDPISTTIPEDLKWLPVWTARSASTGDLLRKIAEFKSNRRNEYKRLIEIMVMTSEKACTDFMSHKTNLFLKGVGEYYHHMKELSDISGIPVISREHKQLAEIAERAGAYYKPSGAGFGDFGLVFFESDSSKRNFVSAIAETKFKIIPLCVDFKGVRKEFNKKGH